MDGSNSLYLRHYGVKGMKWGVRRAQKRDAYRNAKARSLKAKAESYDRAAKERKAHSKKHSGEFERQGSNSKAYQSWKKKNFGNDSDKTIEKLWEQTPTQMYKDHLNSYKEYERKAKQALAAHDNLMAIPADKLPRKKRINEDYARISYDIDRLGKGDHTFSRKK